MASHPPPPPSLFAHHWQLDPAVAFLNHGSFGACPTEVLQYQQQIRIRMERQPVQFFVRELDSLLNENRQMLAEFVGAEFENIALVPNATAGLNAVLRSLSFQPDDELLTTNHEYNACRNALDFTAKRSGARVVVAEIPFPLKSPGEALEAVLSKITERTRLALFDHITSQTGLILPVKQIVDALAERGIDSLVDGAHAPGMVPLNIEEIGAAYYSGNCHKWLCSPKGAALLYVRPDRQEKIHPTSISHGYNSSIDDRSRFLIEFDWTGTYDPTAYLSIAESIRFIGGLLPGGWKELMERNRKTALEGRRIIGQALCQDVPSPDEMIGSIASIQLPEGSSEPPKSALYGDPLQDILLGDYGIEIPIIPWPSAPQRLIRISAQLYNSPEQYEHLAGALKEILG